MKVRLTTDRIDRGVPQLDGQVLDLPEPEALRLVKAGQAEPLPPPPAPAAAKPKRK